VQRDGVVQVSLSNLKHHGAIVGAVELHGAGLDCRGLSRAWWSVEQKVRQPILGNKFLNCERMSTIFMCWLISLLVEMMSWCDTSWSSEFGLYFSTLWQP
jgi:hypothetical protein